MNILLVSFGSSGDINPFIAVGEALQKRNHKVTFITNEIFKTQIEGRGLSFYQVGTKEEYESLSRDSRLFHPRKAFKFIVRNIIWKYMRDYYRAIRELANDQTIVVAQSIAPGARIAHEKLSIPLISLNLQPFSFWSIQKPPFFSGLSIPGSLPFEIKKYILENANKYYIDKVFGPEINTFREELGLPQEKNFFTKWMYSPQKVIGAFPDWFAEPADDWPQNTTLAGFVSSESNSALPPKVESFLKSGNPPLVITVGSAMQHGRKFFKTSMDAVKYLKKRAIIITSFPEQVPAHGEDVLVCDFAPYKQLFPHIEAIIHHAGIGTIAHAIAYAIPQLLVPFAHDQPDNAFRVEKLGLGIKIHPKHFRRNNVIRKLNELLVSDEIKENCKKYSQKIDFESSTNLIADEIENFAGKFDLYLGPSTKTKSYVS